MSRVIWSHPEFPPNHWRLRAEIDGYLDRKVIGDECPYTDVRIEV